MAKKRKASSNMQEVQNAAKTLFANIRFMSPDCPLRTIVMTSSVTNEGKSITSIELAKAIATSGKKCAAGAWQTLWVFAPKQVCIRYLLML